MFNVLNARVTELLYDFFYTIRRTVVHHNDFKILMCLIQDALNSIPKEFSLIEHRDDDTN